MYTVSRKILPQHFLASILKLLVTQILADQQKPESLHIITADECQTITPRKTVKLTII